MAASQTAPGQKTQEAADRPVLGSSFESELQNHEKARASGLSDMKQSMKEL